MKYLQSLLLPETVSPFGFPTLLLGVGFVTKIPSLPASHPELDTDAVFAGQPAQNLPLIFDKFDFFIPSFCVPSADYGFVADGKVAHVCRACIVHLFVIKIHIGIEFKVTGGENLDET